jgi:Group II intron, maturase-specific domain./HNH endonuclease.
VQRDDRRVDLKNIGLAINLEKTRITHTLEDREGKAGLEFLGFSIRQYEEGKYTSKRGYKTLIKPSKAAIKRHYEKLSAIISLNKASSQEKLIGELNPIISGWSKYYSAVVSKKAFGRLDNKVFERLKRWAKRRHLKKSWQYTAKKYWHTDEGKGWQFSASKGWRLRRHSSIPIVRHIKVRGGASPYNGDWSYWATRRGTYPGTPNRVAKLMKEQKGRCEHCGLYFMPDALTEVHPIDGNHRNNVYGNLALVHRHCHDQMHGERRLSSKRGTRDRSLIN